MRNYIRTAQTFPINCTRQEHNNISCQNQSLSSHWIHQHPLTVFVTLYAFNKFQALSSTIKFCVRFDFFQRQSCLQRLTHKSISRNQIDPLKYNSRVPRAYIYCALETELCKRLFNQIREDRNYPKFNVSEVNGLLPENRQRFLYWIRWIGFVWGDFVSTFS